MNQRIKKLAVAFGLLLPLVANAQVMEKYEGMQLNRMSNNGRFVVDGVSGIRFIDRATKQSYSYGTQYLLGMGNSVSDDGIIVGTRQENSVPCYWKDGEWYDLPHNVPNVIEGIATGISSDGKYICGLMGCSGITNKKWPLNQPVLWERNDATGEYEFSILPIPDQDITTCEPQQIQARYISDDGNVIMAQIVDYRGLLQYQLIYNRDENGEWTYQSSGDDWIVKRGSTWPEYPERPVMPRPENYLTQAEVVAFNKANQAYKDSLEIVSLTGKYPKAPFYQDFVKERKEEYDADMAKYTADSDTYVTRLYAFFDAYAENVTNNNFNDGSQRLSANGKYYAANLAFSGPEDPETHKAPTYISPILCDLTTGRFTHTYHNSMASFSVGNDGRILAVTPRTDDKVYTRVPYIINPGEPDNLIPFESWISTESPEAYAWLKENMKYAVEASDSQSGVAVNDSVFFGSIRMNPTFRKMISYVVNPATDTYDSYVIDLDAEPEESGIGEAVIDRSLGIYPNPTADVLYFNDNVKTAELYSLSGSLIWKRNDDVKSVSLRSLGIAPGLYLVRLGSDNGTRTERVIFK